MSLAGRVRVNSVSPGWIETKGISYDGADAVLMLLNTDWTRKGNCKVVLVNTPQWSFTLEVPERNMRFVRIYGDRAVVCGTELFFRRNAEGRLTAYGRGKAVCWIIKESGDCEECILDFGNTTEMEVQF